MRRIILWIILTVFLFLIGSITYTYNKIYRQVVRITEVAKTEFPGNPVEALSSLISSGDCGFEDKNSAIWALGQFADPEALPFLEQLSAETPEDRVPFDRSAGLSKYEIEKAVKWCTKGNLTSWMYRKIK